MWQDSGPYGATPNSYYTSQNDAAQPVPLQFYTPPTGHDTSGFYSGGGGRSSLDGSVTAQGSISSSGGVGSGYGGSIQSRGGWWTAFGTGGIEGEPPLLEGMPMHLPVTCFYSSSSYCGLELGINFGHIWAKSMTVLNPLQRIDERIMDDADLAGPLIFCFCFATFLLLVRHFSSLLLQISLLKRVTLS